MSFFKPRVSFPLSFASAFSVITHNSLHKKWGFPLRTSSVVVTKSAGNCEFCHIYWKILNESLFFVQWFLWNVLAETLYAFDKKKLINLHFSYFECCNESLPNFPCHFWNHKARFCSNFASLVSFMKDNSSVFFLLKPHILWIKIAQRSKIFGLLSAWVKIHIPDFKFEATCQFFFKLCITLQCHEITLLHFFSWDFILFWANQSAKFQTFHFTKFVL